MNIRLLGGLSLGITAGILAGMIGVGGGLVIVPALVYFFKMDQHTAQGTSLAILLPPSGLFAFIEYYKAGHVDVGLASWSRWACLLGPSGDWHNNCPGQCAQGVLGHDGDHGSEDVFQK